MTTNSSSSVQSLNLETWMKDLPYPLKDLPLIHLAIPGSHDSMTYSITRASKLAPDAEPILFSLYPLFRGTILRWTITQAVDTTQQLQIGIRYFDLRLATKQGDHHFYFTHGVYADEISKALMQIKEFVISHPGEVVILDCQHFYGFSNEDHQRLMSYLLNLYGAIIVPRQMDLRFITLNYLNRLKQQIIIVYRNQSVLSTGQFWLPQSLPSPWPQRSNVSGLLHYLRGAVRDPRAGYVHQAVLTPTPAFIVLRFISSLREKCALPVINEVLPVIAAEFKPGAPQSSDATLRPPAPVNVVIADFVEINNAIFPKTIVQMNFELLRTFENGRVPDNGALYRVRST